MAKVRNDVSQLRKWSKEIKNLADKQLDSFLHESAIMLAGEFMLRVTEKTPVGKYTDKIEFTTNPSESKKEVSFQTKDGKDVFFIAKNPPENVSFENPLAGKQGGHLRSSWKMSEPKKIKNGYEVEIFNNATAENGDNYASHVEYGQRIMNKKGGEVKGFKEGVFMMTNTEIEMAFIAPELLEAKFEEFLRQAF